MASQLSAHHWIDGDWVDSQVAFERRFRHG
jgi:hypothetical protein